jgi:hypothetical protein
VKLNTLPLDRRVWRYPEKVVGKPSASLKVSEAFIKALKRVFTLKPSGPKRMEHHAVCIFAEGDEMDLFVTDSASLLVAPVSEPMTGAAKKIAIPREMAEQIAGQCKPDVDLKMFADYFTVQANDKVTLYSNVFDTSEMLDLPGYADRFTDDKTAPPFKLPEGFSAALERAALLAGAEPPTVTLKGSGKALKLSGVFKFGTLDEEFELVKAIPKAVISLDAKTLLSVKGVDKLAIANGFANLRGEDGFMYIMSAKEGEATREVEEAEPEAEADGEAAPVKPKGKFGKRRPTAAADDEEVPFDT